MIDHLLDPFAYQYMTKAIWVCALVGGMCAFLSSYLMLKGWSLIGDALGHSIVPGVAIAYIMGLPYAVGAFFAGMMAALGMSVIKHETKLREDTIIGLVFTTFFAIGLLVVSLRPTAVNIQGIILGNILAISDYDIMQVVIISAVCLLILLLKWKDFLAVFFDESHARSIGMPVRALQIIFFTLLSAATVAALQTVGACLVIAMVVTPGATAYLLTDRFGKLIIIAVALGSITSALGAYISFFLNANPGGLIVTLQTAIFLAAFLGAPKHGLLPPAVRLNASKKGLCMDNLLTWITEPLAYDFMQRALMMALLIAVVCSVFSCFLVLKGWSLMGDAVSHAVLPGLAIAFVIGLPLGVGAFAAGLLCALTTGYLKEHSRVKEDAVMGIVFSGMFAFGLVLLTKIKTDVHLLHVLFGNVLGISSYDLLTAGGIAALCTVIMVIKRKDFALYCFDPAYANVIGLPVKVLHFSLLILLALTIVASIKAAGIILVIAMLIAPGAIGFMLSRSFDKMLMIALSASVFSCISGTIVSYHIDAATAPLIVVIQACLFVVSLVISKVKTARQGKIYARSNQSIA